MPHEDCLPFSIEPSQTDAKSPIDVALMDSLRKNQEFLCDTIFSGVAGKVSGAALSKGAVGTILAGGQDNIGRFWKRRISVVQNTNRTNDKEGFDPENRMVKDRLSSRYLNRASPSYGTGGREVSYYRQFASIPESGGTIGFRLHKGENFFVIGGDSGVNFSTDLKVFIDGQTPTSLGLVDENGATALDTINWQIGAAHQGENFWFMGLDGEDHEITFRNDDATFSASLHYFEYGFSEPSPSLNLILNVKEGKAAVRGTESIFSETDLTFTQTFGGHTGSIVCDLDGNLTAIDGASPAMTTLKSEQTYAFSGGITSLDVKNNGYFPDNGICFYQTSAGTQAIFSYKGKTDTLVQAHSLDNIIWQNEPPIDYTPDDDFTQTNNSANGSGMVHFWAEPPINIDVNNKNIDIDITDNGINSTHTVAVPEGVYSADLVPFGSAVVAALNSVKPIDGNYFCEYNPESQLWSIGVKADTVSEIKFLWNTGANALSSISSIIGFDPLFDSEGATGYIATITKQHLAARVMQPDTVHMDITDPRIKYATDDLQDHSETPSPLFGTYPVTGMALPMGANLTTATIPGVIIIHPDGDAVGLSFSFVGSTQFSTAYTIFIDGTETSIQTHVNKTGVIFGVRDEVHTGLVTFPRGSKNIIIRPERNTSLTASTGTVENYFFGARQWFSKPAWEKLRLDQAIIQAVDVAPISLFRSWNINTNGNLYVPVAGDLINTITESGAWAAVPPPESWAQNSRFTTSLGGFVEYDFTLVGNGGGIEFMIDMDNLATVKVQMFATDSPTAIVEGTDLLVTRSLFGATTAAELIIQFGTAPLSLLGLKAGSYKVRIKHDGTPTTTQLKVNSVSIVDIAPRESNTVFTILDIANNNTSLSQPLHVRKHALSNLNEKDRVFRQLEETNIKEGQPIFINHPKDRFTTFFNERINVENFKNLMNAYNSFSVDSVIGEGEFKFTAMVKSIYSIDAMNAQFGPAIADQVVSLDGRNTPNGYSLSFVGAGALATGVPLGSSTSAGSAFRFEGPAVFSTGNIFLVPSTRGLKIDQPILLFDGVNEERATIDSFVSDTSFTVKGVRAVVVDANVTTVRFQGLHSVNIIAGGVARLSGFAYEPLPLAFTNALERLEPVFETETREILFQNVNNTSFPVGPRSLAYPPHKDGTIGNITTSSVSVVSFSSVPITTNYEITPQLVVTTDGELNISVKSTKEIQKNLEPIL